MEAAKSLILPARRATHHDVSHNLNGQRLGRKGRDTRDRIIAVAEEIISESPEPMITMSEVARRAELRMASLYVYFADVTALILALLEPVLATAEKEYVNILRDYWADEELGEKAHEFVEAYHRFWMKHSRLLHLRNHFSERNGMRLMEQRVRSAQPMLILLAKQIGSKSEMRATPMSSMATVLFTGLERVVTVTTDRTVTSAGEGVPNPQSFLVEAEARLFELGIRDYRMRADKH
jgi:AcrR family transcriptional regulator